MRNWLNYFWCRVFHGGHTRYFVFDFERLDIPTGSRFVRLKCSNCGYRTPGWVSAARPK